MKSLLISLMFVLLFVVGSCGEENDGKTEKKYGSEGGYCYPGGTCDEGYECDETMNMCVEDTSNQVSFCGLAAIANIYALNSTWAVGGEQEQFQLIIDLAACTGKEEIRLVKATLDDTVLIKDYEFMCGCDNNAAVCAGRYATHCDVGSFYGVVFTTAAPTDANVLTLELDAYGLPITGVLLLKPQEYPKPYFFELCEGREEADCEVCNPSCGSRECGSDGCGGQCGSCSGDQICQAGKCVDVSGNDECQRCLSECQGMPSCCTGSGCICEEECMPSCDSPNAWCCSSTGDCMCMHPDNCPY
jgi:hypothetical protein